MDARTELDIIKARPSLALTANRVDYLRRCAENEGGRAILSMDGSNLATVFYFAKEAAHWAGLLLTEADVDDLALPFCACGRPWSRCDGSRAGCRKAVR